MENLTLEECRMYLKRLREICMCYVCHGPLRSPDIIGCIRGHAVCRSCKEHNPTCAVCRSNYCHNKPVTLCQMVEAMPRFCRYNYSCNRILRDNDDHENWCEFRLLSCLYCKSSIECRAFLNHLSDAHNIKPYSMLSADFQRKDFLCDAKLAINVGVTKLLDGHIFNIHYFYSIKGKSLCVHVSFCPTRSIDNSTFEFNFELRSVDKKVSFNFCQEVKITANVKTLIFNIADTILKSFNEKYAIFKTTISGLEDIENKAKTCSPDTATFSSPEQSCSPTPAKRLRGGNC